MRSRSALTAAVILVSIALTHKGDAQPSPVTVTGVPTACTSGVTKIRARHVSTVGTAVTLRVEKVNDWCGASTFNPPPGVSGRIELREGSKTGRTLASTPYKAGLPSVDLTFQQPFDGATTVYAVVASDPNLYATSAVTSRGNFVLADQAPGIKLYSYTCGGCRPDYVLQVDLTIATIRSLLGDVAGTASASLTTGDSRTKTSTRRSIAGHWDRAVSRASFAFAIVNFSFFRVENPARFAFPLKIGNANGGDTISYGYGMLPTTGGEFPNKYRYLRFDNGANTASVGTAIYPASQTLGTFDSWLNGQVLLAGSEIAFGLSPAADKGFTANIPRTFAGTVDRTKDGRPEILFFASEVATQAYASMILRGFGVADSAIVMADGGGSSQLLVRGGADTTYRDEVYGTTTIKRGTLLVQGRRTSTGARPVPHIFAIYAGW